MTVPSPARVALLIPILALALASGACGHRAATPGPGAGTPVDGVWVLSSGDVDGTVLDLRLPGQVTLTADGPRISGSSGCNQYSADLAIVADRVSIGAISMTEMGCEAPAMALEGRYLSALARVTQAQRSGDRLTLTGERIVLTFRPAPLEPTADLVGTTWLLDSLLEGDTAASVIGRPATLVLRADGTATGSTGCRSFHGPWQVDGDLLVLGPMATPRIACRGTSGPQDRHVLAVLDGSVQAVVTGRSLTVFGDRALGLVFRAR
jgi:heat shock protein HslJ